MYFELSRETRRETLIANELEIGEVSIFSSLEAAQAQMQKEYDELVAFAKANNIFEAANINSDTMTATVCYSDASVDIMQITTFLVENKVEESSTVRDALYYN